MNKLDIEARLERSLRNQVRAPTLDGRFKAAVWARVERETASATAPALPAKSAASRWLFASNIAGVVIIVALVGMFGAQAFTGVGVNVTLPEFSPGLVERAIFLMTWPITISALVAGLMFTNVGRRLRADLF